MNQSIALNGDDKLDCAEEQFRRGEGISFSDRDEMNAWLNSL